jgi:hypothetical protein
VCASRPPRSKPLEPARHLRRIEVEVSLATRAASCRVAAGSAPATNAPASQPIAIAVSGHDLWIADYHGALLHFKLPTPSERWQLMTSVSPHAPL